MPRLRISPAVSFLALFLVLCFIGVKDFNSKPTFSPSHAHLHDRADASLLAQRNNNNLRPKGLKYLRSPTGTAAAPAPTPTCYNPPLTVPASQVQVDELCQCASYPQWDENPNPYYNAGEFGDGKVYCQTTCVPKYANQTKSVDATGSLSACMNACDGSFDKRRKEKRISSDEYWFCHGVNFIEGELCQFIGEVAYPAYGSSPGVECYDNGLTPSG